MAARQASGVNTPTQTSLARPLDSYPSPLSASAEHVQRSQEPSSDPPCPSRPAPVRPVHIRRESSRPSRLTPASPPPEIDDFDIADAEEVNVVEELVPPSSPPRPELPRTPRRLGPQSSMHDLAAAEMNGLDVEAIFSPSPSPSPPPATSVSRRPPTESSSSSSATSANRVASDPVTGAPRIHSVEKQYPWTKEVNQKLRQVFMLPGFRALQKEAIDVTMSGKDGALFALPRMLTNSVRPHAHWGR